MDYEVSVQERFTGSELTTYLDLSNLIKRTWNLAPGFSDSATHVTLCTEQSWTEPIQLSPVKLETNPASNQLNSRMMNHVSYTTNTTPTLTPTTLKIIQDSFAESNDVGSFVPPLPSSSQVHVNTWNGGRILNNNDNEEELEVKEIKVDIQPQQQPKKRGGRRATGGRKPTTTSNLTPEEDERRKLRRERNKLAAARCRKRRVDHTNALQDETDQLEEVKRDLLIQISRLQQESENLELILEAHGTCLKPNNIVTRPTTLDLKTPSTPSAGLIDGLEWSLLPTGLTPTIGTGFTPLMTPNTAGAIISSLIKEEVCDEAGDVGELRML